MSASRSKAKPPSTKVLAINLLPKDPFTQSSWGKILTWSLTTGRYIVIFTEMIVVLTFLQRFGLDRQLSNLNEKIFEKQAILESYSDLETEIIRLQNKGKYLDEQESRIDPILVVDYLTQVIPSDIKFSKITVNENTYNLDGLAYSRESLENLIDSIRSYPEVEDVSLDRIFQSQGNADLDFQLRIKFASSEDK